MRLSDTSTTTRAIGSATLAMALSTATALGQDSSRIMWTDPSGVTIETRVQPTGDLPSASHTPEQMGELWRFSDPNSIVERVSVSGTADEVWASFNLNAERVGYFALHGAGASIFDFSVLSLDPRLVAAASAEDASMCLVLTESTSGSSVSALTATGGATPEWTYNFPPAYTFGNKRGVDVSDDGTIGMAALIDPVLSNSQIVVFDTATGNLLNRVTYPGRVHGVELSRDGSRAVLTVGGMAEVVGVPSLDTLTTLTASGAGGWQRISGDGKSVAAGGFNCLVARETSPGIWTTQLVFSTANNWFGNGMALPDDGSQLFVVSHNYATGYLELTYRVFDLSTGNIIAQTSTLGSGASQDSVKVAHSSADGSVFACASWGTDDNVHPEVQVFDPSLNRIGGIDSVGSAFDMHMSRDGRYIASGTKAAHANQFGRGGDVIVIDLGGSCPCACDVDTSTGPGVCDIFDFLGFQNAFVAGDPCACDLDTSTGAGICDIFDFLAFQDEFVGGCP